MKEGLQHTYKSEIKWPTLGKVEVGSDVDFAYIIRKDGSFTMDAIAGRISEDFGLNYEKTQQVLLQEYDVFIAKLVDTFKWGYASKGNFEVHLYDPGNLDQAVRAKSFEDPIISLDPLMHQGVLEFKVSRGYFLSGKKDFGQIPRPGNESLPKQAQNINSKLNGVSASVAEDDIFSGGSVIATLNALLESGIPIKKVIPGIQVGNPKKLAEMGIMVDPVVTYEATDGKDIFDKVDLGDPRDYLLGASGLVVKLPSGEYGRSPYILPFVSTTARASIPQEVEKEFALKVLQANLEFFSNAEEKLGKPVLLSQMNADFMVMMHTIFGFDKNTPMNQVVAWSMDHLDGMWEATQDQGKLQEKFAGLELPKNIVFVDVNGTLIADDSLDGAIDQKYLQELKGAVDLASSKGVVTGLCSDSPLPQLIAYSEKIGFNGPIIAENGNVVYFNNKKVVLHEMKSLATVKQTITENLSCNGYSQLTDCIAPEFGGNFLDDAILSWAFGANRETSVTLFGHSEIMKVIVTLIKENKDLSIDCDPAYPNSIVIHEGNYKKSKGNTLSLFATFGHSILMIGNSMSDWVDPTSGVQCSFVANPRITNEVVKLATYVSNKPLIIGVIDIINKINLGYE